MLPVRKSLFPLALILLLVASFFAVLFPVPVAAQTSPTDSDGVRSGTYRFVARNHIIATIEGVEYDFFDDRPFDNTGGYEVSPADSRCDGRMTFSINGDWNINVTGGQGGGARASGTIDIDVGPACSDTNPDPITISADATHANTWFYWQNSETIILAGAPSNPLHQFVRESPDSSVFVQQGENTCADKVVLTGTSGLNLYRLDSNGGDFDGVSADQLSQISPGQCGLNSRSVAPNHPAPNRPYTITRTENATVDPADNPTPGANGGVAEEDNSCETNSGTLGWIMCPVGGLLDTLTGWLDDQIRNMLMVKDEYFTGNSGVALKNSWTQVRNIAYVILIPIMLVMVIGTALGFEVFSAYTVKRALPRLVIAVIFITLSWYICIFLVSFFNVMGSGAKGLITAPFGHMPTAVEGTQGPQDGLKAALVAAGITESGSTDLESVTSGGALGIIAGIGLYTGLATGALTIGILASTLLSAAIILGLVFILLMVRQMLIIALIMLSPLAILAWIFPANDKMWKLWWSSFSKLLMIFPLIMLVIGIGQVFAFITGAARGEGDNQLVTTIIIIFSYIIPYLFIPAAFKWAGGVFGNLAGMVNDREKGMLDRLKKGRAEKRAQGWQGFKSGTGQGLFQKNAFTRGAGMRVGAGAKGRFGVGERGRQSLDQLARQASVDSVMKGPNWNAVNQNDDALMAATYMSAKQARDGLAAQGITGANADRAIAAVQSSIGFGRPQAIAAAQQLVSTGTGYNGYRRADGTQVGGLQQMTETLARASGGNQSTAASLAGFSNSETKRTGRGDLAPGFGNLNNMVQREIGVPDATGAVGNTAAQYSGATREAWGSLPLSQLVGGKGPQTRAFADYHLEQLTNGNQVQKREAAIALMEMQNSLPYANGGNQRIINQTLQRAGVDTTGVSGMSVEDQLAVLANQPNATGAMGRDLQGRALTGSAIRGYARVYDERMANAQNQQNIQQPPGP